MAIFLCNSVIKVGISELFYGSRVLRIWIRYINQYRHGEFINNNNSNERPDQGWKLCIITLYWFRLFIAIVKSGNLSYFAWNLIHKRYIDNRQIIIDLYC